MFSSQRSRGKISWTPFKPLTMNIQNRSNVVLKPDYYDIFPSYSEEELEQRLEEFPFHLATLLRPKHIKMVLKLEQCKDGLIKFLESEFSLQRALLGEVLEYLGFSQNVVKGVKSVKREVFVPKYYQKYSYLDTTIPFTEYSCLSSPGVVALMLEMLNIEAGEKILEIGIGSGYHACCLLASLNGDCEFCGVEINSNFYSFGLNILETIGYSRVKVYQGNEFLFIKISQKFDRIYTASAFREVPNHIIALLLDNGIFQGTRAITPFEFESEYPLAWLRQTYRGYEDYISDIWQQNFACLATWLLRNGELVEIDKIYDVAFVPYRLLIEANEAQIEKQLFPEFKAIE